MNKINKNKFLKEITFSLLRNNKKRNKIATIAIILTTLLFTTIFTVGFGLKASMERERMRMVGGDFHIGFKELNEEKTKKLIKHELVDEYGIRKMVGFGVNEEFYGENIEISYGDDNYLKHGFIELEEGNMPQEKDEVLIDSKILEMLGKDKSLGQVINIEYEILDELGQVVKIDKNDFKVTGIYEGEELLSANFIFVSKDFIDDFNIIENNYSLNIMTKNAFKLEDKADRIINESGYSTDKSNPKNIDYGINWAYSLESMKSLSVVEIILIILLVLIIILMGYLIIYNIFNISAYLDTKIYGLMKAIGMGKKDLKKIILRQGFIISIWSIPMGCILGYILGSLLLPKITKNLTIGSNFKLSMNPLIFVFTILFSLFTVYVSIIKPGRRISKISPLVAINSEDMNSNIHGIKYIKLNLKNLAIINTLRNKSKLILVVLSLTLSIVVLNSTIIFLGEPDLDKYLVEFIDSDYVLADKSYFNYMYSDSVSLDIIDDIESQSEFESGGAIYLNYDNIINIKDDRRVTLYGLDDEIVKKQKLLGVNNTIETLGENQIIIGLNDKGIEDLLNNKYKYKLGDEITLDIGDKGKFTYEVVGFIAYGMTNTSRSYSASLETDENNEELKVLEDIYYINKEAYEDIFEQPKVMAYHFNVNNIDKMNVYLENLLEENSNYKYDSREIQKDSIKNIQNMFLLIGGMMTFIMATIGILNYINVIVTNVVSRKKELKLMRTIGMTRAEVEKMLRFESMNYFYLTAILGGISSVLFAKFVLKPIMYNLYFTSYRFKANGILILLPIFLIIAYNLPRVIYRKEK